MEIKKEKGLYKSAGNIFRTGTNDYIPQLKKYCKDREVLEIGTGVGYSTIVIAKVAKRVYTCDAWEEVGIQGRYYVHDGKREQVSYYQLKKFLYENICNTNNEDKIHIFNIKSEDLLKIWNKKVGALFIDGNHSEKGVLNDIGFIDYVKHGGYIIFHDYKERDGKPNGVKKVVDEHIRGKYKFVEKNDRVTIVFIKEKSQVMKLYAFDRDQTVSTSNGPVHIEFLRKLKQQGNIVVAIGNQALTNEVPCEGSPANLTKPQRLDYLKKKYPNCEEYIVVDDSAIPMIDLQTWKYYSPQEFYDKFVR